MSESWGKLKHNILKESDNRNFGFIEMIGSIILVLIDPNRGNSKEYLKPQYLKLCRIFGFIILTIIFLFIIFLFVKYN